ncbi:MAG TPA: TonB-dependent receptor [Rhizomicrobium sp.]|nr:TonB-dependent receptor [Rhizomicrobium sp.]
MNRRTIGLLSTSSIVAMAAWVLAAPAAAQPQAQDQGESVTVSASRINIAGFEAPTPVTVIGLEKLERDAKIDIGASIRELPQVGAGASMNTGSNGNNASQGNAGIETVSMRNLGAERNLVLFDGQRVVISTIQNGSVDLSTIPSSLVKRVDVVTGGASAAWGSDAVTGVVNLILDKEFTGWKFNVQGADGTEIEHREIKIEGTWGTEFAGGKGHLILSGNHTWSPDAVFKGQARWWRGSNVNDSGSSLIPNPDFLAGNTSAPKAKLQDHTGSTARTQGGLILGNTAATPSTVLAKDALKGQMFVGPGVTVAPFNFGTAFNGSCYNGCSNNERTGIAAWDFLAVPHHTSTFFGYASFEVLPNVKASVQLNYGLLAEKNSGAIKLGVNPITNSPNPGDRTADLFYADNAYLPASIAAQFGTLTYTGGQANGNVPNQTLKIGIDGSNNRFANLPLPNAPGALYTYNNLCSTVSQPCNYVNRALMRGVFTLEGTLGDDWKWNAYIQSSSVRLRQRVYNNPLVLRYNNAADAVVVTAANVGASGLPVGSIQCRVLLNPALAGGPDAAGCQPMNLFGFGNVSIAASRWVSPGNDPQSGILDNETVYLNQTVTAASIQGVLPWGLPAGNIAVATGAEYRLEQARQFNPDPGRNGAWTAGNFTSFAGQYNVEEGFLEATVPVLKDDYVNSLEFNAAGRFTHYSISGDVQTWKLGALSQVNDDVRLRATWSLDIRAPLINDFFSPGSIAMHNDCPQFNGAKPNFACPIVAGGNPNLQPEKSITLSAGFVLTPHWIEGLTVSVDWYSISLHGLIVKTGFADIVARCFAGETVYCNQIDGLNGNFYSSVREVPANAQAQTTSGYDFDVRYGMDLFSGRLDLGFSGNYTDDFSRTLTGITFQGAGSYGGFFNSGAPKFRAIFNSTYSEGPWSFTAQTRLYGAAVMEKGNEGNPLIPAFAYNFTGGVVSSFSGRVAPSDVVGGLAVPFTAFLDLRASYDVDDNFQVYGAVDNFFNNPPPITSTSGNTREELFDRIGRTVRLGVRFRSN